MTLQQTHDNRISFVSRLPENRVLYKNIVRDHLSTIESGENMVSYNGRYVYVKRVPCQLCGYNAYAYLGLDIEHRAMETSHTFQKAAAKKMPAEDIHNTVQKEGVFVLVSSRKIAVEKILPLYYTRQQIEQIFDIGKNYVDMLPLKVQMEETFQGHLLLTFMAAATVRQIQEQLKSTSMNPISLFMNLRNQKCKVYKTKIVTAEAFKKVNDSCKLFGIECPATIDRVKH